MSVFKPNYTFSGGQCYLIVTPSKQPLWLWAALFWTSPELLRDTVQPRNGTQAGDMYSVAVLFFNILYRLPSYQTDDFTALVPRGRPIHICFFLSMSIYAIIFRNDSGTFRKVVAQVWDARVETDGVGGGGIRLPSRQHKVQRSVASSASGVWVKPTNLTSKFGCCIARSFSRIASNWAWHMICRHFTSRVVPPKKVVYIRLLSRLPIIGFAASDFSSDFWRSY